MSFKIFCFSLIADGDAESEVAAPPEKAAPEVTLTPKVAALDNNSTAALDDNDYDDGSTAPFMVDVTMLSNATATESDLSDTNNPKR